MTPGEWPRAPDVREGIFHLFYLTTVLKHTSCFFDVYEEEHYRPFFLLFFFSLLEQHEHIVSVESMSEFLL